MSNAITFPGLGLSFDIPEVAFTIFGLSIRWYGVIIAIGFLLAFMYGMRRSEEFGYSQDDLIDMLFVATPAGIIGARAYYVIFNFDYFRGDPVRMLQIWTGGLAIYGGVIGALIAAAIVARIKKIKIMSVFDIAALGFLIGQAVGRWGNFVNREAYGVITDLPWRMEIFDWSLARRVAVHPHSCTNLYGIHSALYFSTLLPSAANMTGRHFGHMLRGTVSAAALLRDCGLTVCTFSAPIFVSRRCLDSDHVLQHSSY